MSKVSVAIIGASGLLGKDVLKALKSPAFSSKVNSPIKVLSSKESTTSEEGVETVKADYSNTKDVASKLAGVDVIIELIGPNPEAFAQIEAIVAEVKPKLFIPSSFGCDIAAVQKYAPGFLGEKATHFEKIRALGVKTIDITTSLFAVPGSFSYELVPHYGIDAKTNQINLIGEPTTKISVSTTTDIGNAVAAVATYPDPSKLPDVIKVHSDVVTFQDVFDKYEKDHNVKLTVASKKTAAEGLEEFKKEWATNPGYANFFFDLQVISAQGDAYFAKNDNELLNPNESVWKYEKY